MQENELGVGGGNLIKVREFCFAEIVDTLKAKYVYLVTMVQVSDSSNSDLRSPNLL